MPLGVHPIFGQVDLGDLDLDYLDLADDEFNKDILKIIESSPISTNVKTRIFNYSLIQHDIRKYHGYIFATVQQIENCNGLFCFLKKIKLQQEFDKFAKILDELYLVKRELLK
jgi:hypothetical protein